MKRNFTRSGWLLIPLVGCSLFVLLYIIAACLYPGGSNTDKTARGFDVLHNYWCDLLGPVAKNGEHNPGWRVAMWAMSVLCVALAVFWWIVPRLFERSRWYKILIAYPGIISMAIAPFLFTQYHDLIINLASIPGIIALATTFTALYRHRSYKLFVFGLACLFLIGANNYVYYTGQWLYVLPVLQKITFLLVMTWMGIITWVIYARALQKGAVQPVAVQAGH